MKKSILNVFILSVTLLVACKKDRTNVQPQSNGKTKYKISFNLNGFTQQSVGKATKQGKAKVFSLLSDTASVRAMFDSIGYVLMDSRGNLVHSKIYNAKTYTNSTISDSVVAGTYKVAIFAGHSGIKISNADAVRIWYGTVNGMPEPDYNQFKDTFEQTFPVTVTNTDMNQSVSLNRIVGDIEVVITDNLPSNAYSLILQLSNDYFFYNLLNPYPYNFGGSGGFGIPPMTVIIPDSAKGKPNFTIDYFTINTLSPVSFVVTCYSASGIIAQHAFDTTTVKANVKKIYSGDLFGTPLVPGSGSSTTVNPLWNPITTNISF